MGRMLEIGNPSDAARQLDDDEMDFILQRKSRRDGILTTPLAELTELVELMGTMTIAAAALRAELEAAILADVERLGLDKWSKDTLVKRFMGRGASRTTLYRWVSEVEASGKPDQHVVRKVREAAAARAAIEADPAFAAAADAGAQLPALVKVNDVVSAGAIPVMDRLNQCVAAADQVIAFARTPEGAVRNSKLLLSASEHLRRCLETAARVTETMMRAERVERFHAVIIEEIGKEAPVVAERLAMRLAQLASQWAA
jgi:hypothetical protein